MMIGLFLLLAGCAGRERLYYLAPTLIPGTRPEMNTPGYWTSRVPDRDRVLADEDGLARLIAEIRASGTVTDLAAYPARRPGAAVRKQIATLFTGVSRSAWRGDGTPVTDAWFEEVKMVAGLDAIPETVIVRFCLVTAFADQRLIPTDELCSAEPCDLNFDALQNSGLDLGTPLAILHTSADGEWVYAVAPTSEGWLAADRVTIGSRDQMRAWLTTDDRWVVTVPKADIFADDQRTEHIGFARFGTRLPVASVNLDLPEGVVPVGLPSGLGFVRQSELHSGSLPYTPRTMIELAFAMLNAPYGWGDMYGEQDCSAFIRQLFACVGLELPRNSAAQGKVGRKLDFNRATPSGEKAAIIIRDGIPGATLLVLDGHIMLYLGVVNGEPYVIHDLWAYRQPDGNGDLVRAVNRVVVSTLDLGAGSARGSLLERLTHARLVLPAEASQP